MGEQSSSHWFESIAKQPGLRQEQPECRRVQENKRAVTQPWLLQHWGIGGLPDSARSTCTIPGAAAAQSPVSATMQFTMHMSTDAAACLFKIKFTIASCMSVQIKLFLVVWEI